MKLLFYGWGANNEAVLKENLIKCGHELVECTIKCKDYTKDIELASSMIEQIHRESVEGIVSFNYFPIISMVADVTKITYYSWVYDCPHFTLYARTVGMPCNRIGIFDNGMVEELKARGINTVFHLPLGVDTERFEKAIRQSSDSDKKKYECDVSFVGSLYDDEHNYYDMIFGNSDAGLMDSRCFDYDNNVSVVDEAMLRKVALKMEEMGLVLGPDYQYEPEDIIIPAVFEKKITILERKKLLTAVLNMEDISFKLYTNSKIDLKSCGTVDYETKMPIVFNRSRINLNISLRSIHTGIPLRVLDIMACGGFVISNYQKEIAESFEGDKEIVMFRSMEEAVEKVRYYLDHEEERSKIAKAGFEAVKERFGYKDRIGELITNEKDSHCFWN